MGYEANLNSALTYYKVDRKELARESLFRAYAEVPDEEKSANNSSYHKILALIAKLLLQEKNYDAMSVYLEQGLASKPDNADLLFLKMLYLFDLKLFDEMFAIMGIYLLVVAKLEQHTIDQYLYEFSSEKAVKETIDGLLPIAYRHSSHREKIVTILTQLAQVSDSQILRDAVARISSFNQE